METQAQQATQPDEDPPLTNYFGWLKSTISQSSDVSIYMFVLEHETLPLGMESN